MNQSKSSKAPIVRGARACTVCRTAKMKCVGAEDGQPCQRCKRSGVDCVFEKHRRGRKPGSKLSEASKMLRRLEKGLNNAKLKNQSHEATISKLTNEARAGADRFQTTDLPLSNFPLPRDRLPPPTSSTRESEEEDTDESDKNADVMFPAQLIKKENQLQRNSFFRTILNPENTDPQAKKHPQSIDPPSTFSESSPSFHSRSSTRSPSAPPHLANATLSYYPDASDCDHSFLKDPIAAGIISEERAVVFFDAFFLRLNPFVNLFDPYLHTMQYIRSRCSFLFTTIMMSCCKFFASDLYPAMKKLANEFAIRAFAENWKRLEVVQAFACLCYWKDPDDTRTWTYIGYACRMAVELGLNRYVGDRLSTESDLQWRERRNRERTYLVLFVHDRSLSTQTGRQWMLSEDELVRRSSHWHEEVGVPAAPRRPEDVIVAAFVQLRLIASETVTHLHLKRGASPTEDTNLDDLLKERNYRLAHWVEHWKAEMEKAEGGKFHIAFLRFFWLYVRLFLNTFGIHLALSSPGNVQPNLDALHMCYTSALEHLQSVVDDFADMSTLRYGQDTITVMTAYCAVVLLKLARSPNTAPALPSSATEDIHRSILNTAEAYDKASDTSNALTSAAHHSRFLRGLVRRDIYEAQEQQKVKERREKTASMSHGCSSWAQSSGSSTEQSASSAFSAVPSDATTQGIISQLPQSNPHHSLFGPFSMSPSAGSSLMLPQPYTVRDANYHAPGPSSRPANAGGVHNSYAYLSSGDSPPGPVVPSQSHQQALALSDAAYSRSVFRDLGEMVIDLYPAMYSQQQHQARAQGWVHATESNYGNGPPAPHPGGEYNFHSFGSYQPPHGYNQGIIR